MQLNEHNKNKHPYVRESCTFSPQRRHTFAMDSEFFKAGFHHISMAILCDKKDDHAAALALYHQGLEEIHTGLKYIKGKLPSTYANVIAAIIPYEERVGTIRQIKLVPAAQSAGMAASQSSSASSAPAPSSSIQSTSSGEPKRHLVNWDDVVGLTRAKTLLFEAVILPIRFPAQFQGIRKPWKSVLLYGPPGTGKSHIATALANYANINFIGISSSDLISKYQGDSEKAISELFRNAIENSPSILFVDEIDSMCATRTDADSDSTRRIKNEFLLQMSKAAAISSSVDKNGKAGCGHVLVVGATNMPWNLDSAMLRRMDKRIYIPLPNAEARINMFKKSLQSTKNSITEAEFVDLGSARTEGFSGSDITIVSRGACYAPLSLIQSATHFSAIGDKWLPCVAGSIGATKMTLSDIKDDGIAEISVTFADVVESLATNKASVEPDTLARFDKWTHQHGQDGC